MTRLSEAEALLNEFQGLPAEASRLAYLDVREGRESEASSLRAETAHIVRLVDELRARVHVWFMGEVTP